MSQVIDGKVVADAIIEDLKQDTIQLKERGINPGLVVLLVGENPASQTYVNSKHKKSQEIGIVSKVDKIDASISEQDLLDRIESYNNDPTYTGILVQLPLPDHISEEKVLDAIDPKKDVDGFHPINVGQLVIGNALAKPCTPAGIIELIRSVCPDTSGMHAVVIGRSNIVGKPIANMLLQANKGVGNCTVTICHSRTKNLTEEVKRADIVVVAIGKANFLTKDMIKEGAIVIDVGINRIPADNEKGYRLVGDVDYDDVFEKASAVTPVPGGVGRTTIAMLMKNTIELAKHYA